MKEILLITCTFSKRSHNLWFLKWQMVYKPLKVICVNIFKSY